jgi:hypothetical protein
MVGQGGEHRADPNVVELASEKLAGRDCHDLLLTVSVGTQRSTASSTKRT